MKILSLDQALNVTGYAIFDNHELTSWGHFKTTSSKPIEHRLCEIWKHLNDLLNQYNFEYVVFEDIQKQTNQETYKKLAYVQAAVMIWCYNQNIKFTIYSPSHWRKILKETYNVIFGRKREEQKKAAIEFVNHMNNMIVSSDEADAICIGYAYLAPNAKSINEFEGF